MATFSDILKKARSVKGLSQAQLAKAADVDHTVVSRWERGIVVPRADSPLVALLRYILRRLRN